MTGVVLVASLAAAVVGARSPSFIVLRWQAPLDVSEVEGAPAVQGVANGLAVVRRDDDCLLFSADTGTALGKLAVGDAQVVLTAGHLVVLDHETLVGYAVGAGGVQKRWRIPVASQALIPRGSRLDAVDDGRTVLLSGSACGDRCPNEGNPDRPGELVAVDVTDGTTRWRRTSDGPGIDALAVAGDRYVVASRCEAIAHAGDTGRVLWRTGRCRSDSDEKALVTSTDDAVFFSPAGRKLAKLERMTGRRRWNIALGGMAAVALAATDSAVYVGLREGTRFARPRPSAVRAFDAATGRPLWEHAFDVRRLLVADGQSLVVEEMGKGARTRLSLVDRATGDVRDTFRVGRGEGVQIERGPGGQGRLVVGSSVGVLGLGLAAQPAVAAPRRIPGRLTATGAALAGFPILYEARGPGWPTHTVTTDAKGEFEIVIDAPDVVPIWLLPEAVERHRQATSAGNPRWDCMSEPRVHYALGARASAPARLDTGLICFDPLE
jgi:outer membrane protein assembly factor BamB